MSETAGVDGSDASSLGGRVACRVTGGSGSSVPVPLLPDRRLGVVTACAAAITPTATTDQVAWRIRRTLFGRILWTEEEIEERLSKVKALATFSSDNLSSVAYATEAMMFTLLAAGTAASAPHADLDPHRRLALPRHRSPTARRSAPTRVAAAAISSPTRTSGRSRARRRRRGAPDGPRPDRLGKRLERALHLASAFPVLQPDARSPAQRPDDPASSCPSTCADSAKAARSSRSRPTSSS